MFSLRACNTTQHTAAIFRENIWSLHQNRLHSSRSPFFKVSLSSFKSNSSLCVQMVCVRDVVLWGRKPSRQQSLLAGKHSWMPDYCLRSPNSDRCQPTAHQSVTPDALCVFTRARAYVSTRVCLSTRAHKPKKIIIPQHPLINSAIKLFAWAWAVHRHDTAASCL